MGGRVVRLGLGLGAMALAARLGAGEARPLVAVLETCSALSSDIYPADTQNWFDVGHNAQIIFYAHLLFPVDPLPDETEAAVPVEAWHPPMAVVALRPPSDSSLDGHYAEAEWLDPAGRSLALYGETLTARAKTDWVSVAGRSYVPHTFAMAIGTRDMRLAAGQTHLPDQKGEYTVRLRVDGRSVGLAFFRMLSDVSKPVAPRRPDPGRQASAAPVPTKIPLVVPTLEPLKFP